MLYETFLFTRNQQRDFTAFIRPGALTNKDVSVIASALNHVHNIADLTPNWPALYSFPLGEYHLLLRHYDSGRKHAGRNIGVVEGIAVRRDLQPVYQQTLPHLLAQQDEVLNIADSVESIEAATVQQSEEKDWPDPPPELPRAADEAGLISDFAARLTQDRLFLPFTQDGRSLLIAALSDPRLRIASFAFGTNPDVLAGLYEADIETDIVSYFNTSVPALRSRQTNQITRELTDFTAKLPPRPPGRIPVKADPDYPTETLPDRRVVRQAVQQRAAQESPLAHYEAGDEGMPTLREMRRREREQQAAQTQEHPPEDSQSWLLRLVARLLGRSS